MAELAIYGSCWVLRVPGAAPVHRRARSPRSAQALISGRADEDQRRAPRRRPSKSLMNLRKAPAQNDLTAQISGLSQKVILGAKGHTGSLEGILDGPGRRGWARVAMLAARRNALPFFALMDGAARNPLRAGAKSAPARPSEMAGRRGTGSNQVLSRSRSRATLSMCSVLQVMQQKESVQ